jgi:phosphoserine phosphatase RsbU/P
VILPDLLAAHASWFETLAQLWLDQGAARFAVWTGGRELASWTGSATGASETAQTACPIIANGEIIGELRVTGMDGPPVEHRLKTDSRLVAGLAPHARDLFNITSELVSLRDQLLAIYNLTHTSRNCLGVEQLLKNLVSTLPQLGKIESAFVLLQTRDDQRMVFQAPGIFYTEEELWQIAAHVRPDHHLLLNGENQTGSPGVNNLLLLGLKARGARLAVLGLINKSGASGETFMSPDIKLAQAIAAYAGAQLENVLLYQANMRLAKLKTEMELAQNVQLSLIPRDLPRVRGVEVAASFVPASLVGGDFYDFIVRPGLPVTFAIGDLTGKGFPAALLMSMTRTALRTEINAISSPALILQGMNMELYDDLSRLDSFATVFLGQYYPRSREILYANAGHSPAIYCPREGKARMLAAGGTPLGIQLNRDWDEEKFRLNPGDTLVVGTDGLAEASELNQLDRFGYQRMLDLVEALSNCSAVETMRAIEEAVRVFSSGTQQEDDQTLVVLKGTR